MQEDQLGERVFSFEYIEFKMFIQAEWEVEYIRLGFEREKGLEWR